MIKLNFTCAFILLAALSTTQANAASCDDNFTVSGSFFSGKTYKTWANLPAGKFESAYKGAYLSTLKEGWKILKLDKELGIISAAQAVQYAKGKLVPLTIAIEKSDAATKISLTYSTPAGLATPEDAVKLGFCNTVVAADMMDGSTNETVKAVAPKPSGQLALAVMSPEQKERITKEFEKKVPDVKLQAMIGEAGSAIKELISLLSCLPNNWAEITRPGNRFTIYAAPGKSLFIHSPAAQTPYHNVSSCLSVVRIQAWQAPALNALKFEVVYQADDSGEAAKTSHEIVKQPDGLWLFNR